MKVYIEFPTERVISAIISGVEGGIGYWARVTHYNPEKLELTVDEMDDSGREKLATYKLNYERFSDAVGVMAVKYPQHLGNLLSTTRSDANTGDVLIQCACFGELKYS